MRKTKYRAWDIKGQVMIDWNCMCQTAFNRGDSHLLYDVMTDPGVNFIRLQYTGLKDRSGKDIYEGDIVQCLMSVEGGALPHIGEIVFILEFGAFATKNLGGETLLHHHCLNTIQIIGNIYENPELISEGATANEPGE